MESHTVTRESACERWNALEEESDACVIASRRLELVYLNASAREIAAESWFGRRCWEALPAAPDRCPSNCPALKAVATGSFACAEETLFPDGVPVTIQVIVCPIEEDPTLHDGGALLVMRPQSDRDDPDEFRARLRADAVAIAARVL